MFFLLKSCMYDLGLMVRTNILIFPFGNGEFSVKITVHSCMHKIFWYSYSDSKNSKGVCLFSCKSDLYSPLLKISHFPHYKAAKICSKLKCSIILWILSIFIRQWENISVELDFLHYC